MADIDWIDFANISEINPIYIKNKYYFNMKYYLILFFLLVSSFLMAQTKVQLITDKESKRFGQLQITGLPTTKTLNSEDWQPIFKIQYGNSIQENLPSMLGTYESQKAALYFQPRFPFTQGKSYTLMLDAALFYKKTGMQLSTKNIIHTFQVPVLQEIKPTYVEHIYPSAAILPMNQLKLYVQFSASMRTGQAFDRLQLLDEKGEVVLAPFLYMDKELWDKDHQRLTVWFDPGRIKRDLPPHELLGLPLQAGQFYQLVVHQDWQDLNGNSLQENFIKQFRVVESDREMPKTANWKLNLPQSQSQEALIVDFKEPMDAALLEHSLVVLNEKNEMVTGIIELKNQEKVWHFTPIRAWQSGNYTIQIATILEDLAGNNLNRLFDRNVGKDAEAVLDRKVVEIAFQL